MKDERYKEVEAGSPDRIRACFNHRHVVKAVTFALKTYNVQGKRRVRIRGRWMEKEGKVVMMRVLWVVRCKGRDDLSVRGRGTGGFVQGEM